MDRRLMHYQFVTDHIPVDDTATFSNYLDYKVAAVVEDTADEVIFKAILAAAQAEEVTDLYLIDKKFILDAIREKRERENPKPLTNADKLRTMDETAFVRFLDDVTWSALESGRDLSKLKYPPDTMGWREWLRQPLKPKEEHHEV